jgi:hypothetical protein
MDDFYKNLNLSIVGLNPCKGEEIIKIIINARIKEVYGKRECIG